MGIAIGRANDDLTVTIGPRLTFSDHEDFGDVLTRIEDSDAKRVVIDFADTEFIDSSAMGMLLIAKDVAGERGVKVTLRGANADIKRLFELGTFSEFFTIED